MECMGCESGWGAEGEWAGGGEREEMGTALEALKLAPDAAREEDRCLSFLIETWATMERMPATKRRIQMTLYLQNQGE